MLDVKKTLAKILETIKTDYVVEQGTSGIWTYRKWNSGIAECWGEVSKGTTFSVWTSPMYYGVTYTGHQTYPADLFSDAPDLYVALKHCGCDAWLSKSAGLGTKTETPSYYPVRVASASGTISYTVSFHAIGRWK